MKPWHEDDAFWSAAETILFCAMRRQAAAAEVEQVIRLLELEPGASVLDLCCGVGRHALELARRGFRVTAVDRTEAYLSQARRTAQAEGLAMEIVRDDMRRFARPEAFDGALNLFTSFGYFDDPMEDRRVAENLRRSLRPGGRLVMDLMGKEVLARIFRERDWHEDDGVILLEERRVEGAWSRIETCWIVFDAGGRRELCLSLRLYAASEIEDLLLAAGFAKVAAYGDLAGAPYDQTAKRLVIVAQAPDPRPAAR